MATKKAASPETASTEVATIDTSKTDEFTAALQAAGFLNKASGSSDFNRITAKGANLFYNKELIAAYNPVTKEPALIVQLTDAPVEYQSMWFEGPLALAVGRPEVSGRFCKSHFDDPNEDRNYSEAYGPEGKRGNCRECPVSPFVRPEDLPAEAIAQNGASKCSWKGDVEFKILTRNADGQLEANDDTIYTISLATTGIIEFKGSNSRNANQLAGSISPENFMVQLAKLGIEKWGKEGLLKAHTYLRLGGVIAELHLPLKQDGSKTWNIPSFKPIEILEVEDVAKLETSDAPADAGATDDDDVPF